MRADGVNAAVILHPAHAPCRVRGYPDTAGRSGAWEREIHGDKVAREGAIDDKAAHHLLP